MQHCCLQTAGDVPPIAQRWKQLMLDAQGAFPRQFSVCEQHEPTMHCEQGVPPGSRLHEPASASGRPQLLPLHTRPVQHCELCVQLDPGGKQEPAPQTPP